SGHIRAELFADPTEDNLRGATGNEKRFAALKAMNLRRLLRVELVARGRFLGTILLGTFREERKLTASDISFAEDLAYRVASAVDNALLFHEVEAAVKVRDEFLAIASHELRTPLTPLKLHAQQLMRSIQKKGLSGISQESLLRMVQTTNRQVERLSKLIDSLLDITRISRGKLKLTASDFVLGEMVEEILARLAPDFELAECEFKADIDNTIRVRWDSFRMDQVIENLLSNAIKYARGKPVELKISREGKDVKISVRDHGIGISAEDQKRIFKRFERAVSSSHFGGLGLGLYIVSQILDAHKGFITVESELGKGSLFTVIVPAELPETVESVSGSAAS
ncbi:MAG: GAF domain-containing sensor histidine kinase, partial [Bdellovibrionota bacterium]